MDNIEYFLLYFCFLIKLKKCHCFSNTEWKKKKNYVSAITYMSVWMVMNEFAETVFGPFELLSNISHCRLSLTAHTMCSMSPSINAGLIKIAPAMTKCFPNTSMTSGMSYSRYWTSDVGSISGNWERKMLFHCSYPGRAKYIQWIFGIIWLTNIQPFQV